MSLPTGFIKELSARAEAEAEGLLQGFTAECESPIEAIFLTAFYFVAREYGGFSFGEPSEERDVPFFVKPQESIPPSYRADFVIGLYQSPQAPRIVVECDGHDFHERTKEQAARDRSRDRAIQGAGFLVFRFTGSEIYRDAFKCADEVVSHLIKIDAGIR